MVLAVPTALKLQPHWPAFKGSGGSAGTLRAAFYRALQQTALNHTLLPVQVAPELQPPLAASWGVLRLCWQSLPGSRLCSRQASPAPQCAPAES